MTAAGFPWIFVALWFMYLPGIRLNWKHALLAARFAAPTSAGILFRRASAHMPRGAGGGGLAPRCPPSPPRVVPLSIAGRRRARARQSGRSSLSSRDGATTSAGRARPTAGGVSRRLHTTPIRPQPRFFSLPPLARAACWRRRG